MNTHRQLIVLGLLFVLTIYGCGGASIPQGAQKIGRYEGTFTSAMLSGTCQVDLYRLPNGNGTFEGYFQGTEEDVFLSMKGQMTGNNLEGTFFGEGVFAGSTISGVLTGDENSMSGTFALNTAYSVKGTWIAQRK
jgi:hypothetical protein